jgi:hypothetical protein
MDWFIESQRLPNGWSSLPDPHGWPRAQLNEFYRHVLAGQRSEIPESNMIQFRNVNSIIGTSTYEYREFCNTRPPACALSWGPDEKLYAIRLESEKNGGLLSKTWNGLPMARTQGIYQSFDASLALAVRNISTPVVNLSLMITLLGDFERKGPVHVSPSNTLVPRSIPQLLSRFPDHCDRCGRSS